MTKCTQPEFAFPSCKSRKVTADFAGGNITSFGGVLLLKQADRQLGLTRSAARCIPDARRQASVTHTIQRMIVKRIRQAWPDVKIIFRGDSGFCRWKMLRWCERHHVDYIVGLAKNPRLKAIGADLMEQAEHSSMGSNPRFIVTSLEGDPQGLYDHLYCARGDMENRIKEQQLDLYADRTSCHQWWANQFRLLLSSMAYLLCDHIRRRALQNTRLARATCATIRNKLIRIGVVVLRNTRRVRLHFSSACPHQDLFALAAAQLE